MPEDIGERLKDARNQAGIRWRQGMIAAIGEARKKGWKEVEIRRYLVRGGCTMNKADELMQTAKFTEGKEEPEPVDTSKLTQELVEWIHSNHYDKLTKERLVKKIMEIKNQDLRINWLKQLADKEEEDELPTEP